MKKMGQIRTIDDLASRGFVVEDGIEMCAGDEELYWEVLAEALEESHIPGLCPPSCAPPHPGPAPPSPYGDGRSG